jgi:multiple sugar transport system ATP-binding protein
MATVSFKQVHKRFGDQVVIPSFSLDVADKELLVLIGPSGCGKSTLLRLLAGLEETSAGTIEIDGRPVNDLAPKDRDIAMVFQNYALYPHMNVYDNMAFGLKMRKYSRDEIRTRVTEAARILEMEDLLTRKPSQLSGGQRQRVAMGRAIVRKPKVFLFDEPLSNLDAKLRVQMRLEIQRLHRRIETTIVYVTHDQVEAMTLADRIAVVDHGELQQIGSPNEIYNYPSTRFVAGFMGSPPMNFIQGKLTDHGLEAAPFRIKIPATVGATAGNDIVLGVRPEHVKLGEAEENYTSGTVEVVESLGAVRVVYVRAGEFLVAATVDAGSALKLGATVGLKIDESRAHFFEADSGRRIGTERNGG